MSSILSKTYQGTWFLLLYHKLRVLCSYAMFNCITATFFGLPFLILVTIKHSFFVETNKCINRRSETDIPLNCLSFLPQRYSDIVFQLPRELDVSLYLHRSISGFSPSSMSNIRGCCNCRYTSTDYYPVPIRPKLWLSRTSDLRHTASLAAD